MSDNLFYNVKHNKLYLWLILTNINITNILDAKQKKYQELV